jgi:predicted nucleotidyltransferase component of viral defense system
VEQDLLLSRAVCEIAGHPYLGQEPVFRGGTALHKLHLPRPLRYSEDLDYVRTSASGVGEALTALRQTGQAIGFVANSQIGRHPKVVWRARGEDGAPIRIKIEINTHERSPALRLVQLPFRVGSGWWTGSAGVQTFQPAELIATKIRALYQRSKGRDLFDLWLALTELALDPDAVLDAFAPYRPEGLTAAKAIANLEAKLADEDFRHDIDKVIAIGARPYSIDQAAALITAKLLSRI